MKSCENVPAPYAFFPSHGSALGFDYFDEPDGDPIIKNSFLVALHGSTNKNVGHGYKIVIMRKGEKVEDFISGFLQGKNVVGRPCGILKLDANSFLFTDDYSGVIYSVHKKGSTTSMTNTPAAEQTIAENSNIQKSEEKPQAKSCFGIAALLFVACLRLVF